MSHFSGKTVLVTGATGFLGGALARRLAAEGAHVKALARREGRDSYIRNVKNIEIVTGNITDADRMIEVTQTCDYVFHSAALILGKYARQYETNVNGTRNVAQAAAHAGVKRLIHISTIATYGYKHQGIITETTPPSITDIAYNTSKLEAEHALRELAQQTGLSYSICRPGMIYGERSGAWTDLAVKLANRRPVPFLGDGNMLIYLIHVDDLLDMLLLLATHPAAESEAFNCVYQPQVTMRDYIAQYMALVNNDSRLAFPLWMVKSLAPLADIYLNLRRKPQDVQDLLRMLEANVIFSMDKAQNLLGWQPKIGLEEGIQHTVPYLREAGLL